MSTSWCSYPRPGGGPVRGDGVLRGREADLAAADRALERADRRTDVMLGDRRVDAAGRAPVVGKPAAIAGMASPLNRITRMFPCLDNMATKCRY